MNEVARTIDNPLFLYGAFSRLRPPGVWVVLSIVGVLCLFLLGIPFAASLAGQGDFRHVSEGMTGVLWGFYVLQWIVLTMVAVGAASSAVAGQRDSGVFELLRMAPYPRHGVVAGYIFGATIREHLLFAVTIPFMALAGLLSTQPVWRLPILLAGSYLSAVLFILVSLLLSMSMRRTKQAASSAVGFVLLYNVIAGWMLFPFLSSFPLAFWALGPANTQPSPVNLLGLELPLGFYALIFQAALIPFLWTAAARRFRGGDRPSLSKLQVLLMLLVLAALMSTPVVGGTRGSWIRGLATPALDGAVVISILFGLSLFLTGVATPSASLHTREGRRAARMGRESVPLLSEGGLNLAYLAGAAALMVVPCAAQGLAGEPWLGPLITSTTALLFFGSLLQWIKLKYGRSWVGALAAWLFLFWGAPVLLAILASFAEAAPHVTHVLGGLFPGIGVLMSNREKLLGSAAIVGLLNIFGSLVFTLKAVGTSRGLWGVGGLLPDATAPRRRE